MRNSSESRCDMNCHFSCGFLKSGEVQRNQSHITNILLLLTPPQNVTLDSEEVERQVGRFGNEHWDRVSKGFVRDKGPEDCRIFYRHSVAAERPWTLEEGATLTKLAMKHKSRNVGVCGPGFFIFSFVTSKCCPPCFHCFNPLDRCDPDAVGGYCCGDGRAPIRSPVPATLPQGQPAGARPQPQRVDLRGRLDVAADGGAARDQMGGERSRGGRQLGRPHFSHLKAHGLAAAPAAAPAAGYFQRDGREV